MKPQDASAAAIELYGGKLAKGRPGVAEFLAEMDMAVTCDRCGKSDTLDPSWRWNGERWEHKCMLPGDFSQAGHIGIGLEASR